MDSVPTRRTTMRALLTLLFALVLATPSLAQPVTSGPEGAPQFPDYAKWRNLTGTCADGKIETKLYGTLQHGSLVEYWHDGTRVLAQKATAETWGFVQFDALGDTAPRVLTFETEAERVAADDLFVKAFETALHIPREQADHYVTTCIALGMQLTPRLKHLLKYGVDPAGGIEA